MAFHLAGQHSFDTWKLEAEEKMKSRRCQNGASRPREEVFPFP